MHESHEDKSAEVQTEGKILNRFKGDAADGR